MKFKCQNSGKCCTHPNIVVTLTHEDIYRLMQHINDFSILISKIQFMVDPDIINSEDIPLKKAKENKTILKKIKTSSGEGTFILRRIEQKKCTFFDTISKMCTIHQFRPQACRNFPFSFNVIDENKPMIVTWVKKAKEFCPGIGIGNNYQLNALEILGKKTVKSIETFNNIIGEINKEIDIDRPLTPQEALLAIYMVADKHKESFIEVNEIL